MLFIRYEKKTRYLVRPKDWILVKGCGFLSFAKNISKNTGKNPHSKYSQNVLSIQNNLLQIYLNLSEFSFIVAGTVTNEVPTFALNSQFDVPVVILSN